MKKTRILIIGAGPAGLSTLKALKQLSPRQKYQIKCIQKQQNWGGQWNYSWRNGVNKYGQLIHSGMYSELWTNAPKQCYQFPDYTLKQHYHKAVPSYLPRDIHKQYFMSRFIKHGITKDQINFNTIVRNIFFNNKNNNFQTRLTNLCQNYDYYQKYDYVIIASGHFSTPNMPYLQGIQKFKGIIQHSHGIRMFNEYNNKTIMIIGGGRSAEDLIGQCYKYNAKKIIWTYRRLKEEYNKNNIPENVEMMPNLARISGYNTAQFMINNQKQYRDNIDCIIFCTGYLHHFPYLQQSLRLSTKNILYPQGLYKNCVYLNNPRLFYIAMGSYMLGQVVADIQSHFIRDIINNSYKLPDFNDIYYKKDSYDQMRQQQMKKVKNALDGLKSTVKYARHIMSLTNYPQFNIEGVVQLYKKSIQNKNNDLINYRDINNFKSNITGQQSINGNKKWIDMKQVQMFDHNYQQKIKEFFDFTK